MLKESVSPAESVTVTAACRKPVVVGVKLMSIVQDAFAARLPEQEFPVIVKSPAAKLLSNPETAPSEAATPLTPASALIVNAAGGSALALWLQKVKAGPNGQPWTSGTPAS
jgi:hypothetical protein